MLLFFDTETTGKPQRYNAPVDDLQNWPRVVQLGWLQCDAHGKELAAGEAIILPDGFKIPPDAARIHGITTERAAKEGVALRTVLDRFAEAVSSATTLIAHNMGFDENVLGAEFLRAGMANPLTQAPRICTMRSSTDHCKLPGQYGYKWPALEELYRVLFSRELQGHHTALADVRACAECFFELQRLGVIRLPVRTRKAKRRP